jgi:hypothetical protein
MNILTNKINYLQINERNRMKKAVLFFGILLLTIQLKAQVYPVVSDPADILNKSAIAELRVQNEFAQKDTNDLLADITAVDKAEPLLPEHMLFTQRMLWGKKGLMRNFKYFNLTPENRARELKIRRIMLTTHQIVGIATLAGMVAQGVVGSNLFNITVKGKVGDPQKTKDLHEALASAINIGYFTTAGLAFFTPPKMLDNKKGCSTVKIHMGLAIVHLTGMIATNVLAGQIETARENAINNTGTWNRVNDLRKYHRDVAFATFGSFAAAMIVLSF